MLQNPSILVFPQWSAAVLSVLDTLRVSFVLHCCGNVLCDFAVALLNTLWLREFEFVCCALIHSLLPLCGVGLHCVVRSCTLCYGLHFAVLPLLCEIRVSCISIVAVGLYSYRIYCESTRQNTGLYKRIVHHCTILVWQIFVIVLHGCSLLLSFTLFCRDVLH